MSCPSCVSARQLAVAPEQSRSDGRDSRWRRSQREEQLHTQPLTMARTKASVVPPDGVFKSLCGAFVTGNCPPHMIPEGCDLSFSSCTAQQPERIEMGILDFV